jgi:hypothetical protein
MKRNAGYLGDEGGCKSRLKVLAKKPFGLWVFLKPNTIGRRGRLHLVITALGLDSSFPELLSPSLFFNHINQIVLHLDFSGLIINFF